MRRTTTSLSLILCLLLSTLPSRSRSQVRGPQDHEEAQRREQADQQREEFNQRREQQEQAMIQRQQEFFQRTEEQRLKNRQEQEAINKVAHEYSDEAWQDALGVAAEQWPAVRARLEAIRRLKAPVDIDLSIYWVAGSGSYQVERFLEGSDGAQSTVKTSGQFSATQGVRATSESSLRAPTHAPVLGSTRQYTETSYSGGIRYGQFSATTGISILRQDFAQSGVNMGVHALGNTHDQSSDGAVSIQVQPPGPVKKQVGDINLGWRWLPSWIDKSPETLSEYEKASAQLLGACEVDKPDSQQIRQQVETLRHTRRQRQAELEEARQQLRDIVTPEQEAKLILMGYLD